MLAFLLLVPAAAFAGKPEKAAEIAAKAEAAKEAGDLGKASKLATKALKLDPDNVKAHLVAGFVLLTWANSVTGQTHDALVSAAAAHWQRVAELDPDSIAGGIARDFLDSLQTTKTVTLPARVVVCPAEAEAALNRAELAYHRKDFVTAGTEYESATRGCPDNYEWWTWYGDLYFMQQDYGGAIRHYRKSLELEPCFSTALRFEADVLVTQGKREEAWDTALRAVACDPTYDAGWQMLAALAPGYGRPRIVKPPVDPGGKVITVSDAPDSSVWLVYSLNHTLATGSRLERERDSVRKAIQAWKEMGSPEGGAWKLLAAADAAGHLDPAIFMWMLDAELVPEFMAWRVAHLEETATFLDSANGYR